MFSANSAAAVSCKAGVGGAAGRELLVAEMDSFTTLAAKSKRFLLSARSEAARAIMWDLSSSIFPSWPCAALHKLRNSRAVSRLEVQFVWRRGGTCLEPGFGFGAGKSELKRRGTKGSSCKSCRCSLALNTGQLSRPVAPTSFCFTSMLAKVAKCFSQRSMAAARMVVRAMCKFTACSIDLMENWEVILKFLQDTCTHHPDLVRLRPVPFPLKSVLFEVSDGS
mmetsp:Transcript_69558/g.123028  ORF Transcript_69558/g.123028 Transcript_69558/m.123028 type:complete len:223 (+) Transcript_69558:649-1317(+)